MTRAFIAIELNDDAHAELSSLEAKLKKADADVTWVKPENIHLTLKFLGDITDEQVEAVKSSLDEIAKVETPFSFKLKGMGAFPKLEYPRVLWVGIEGADPTPLYKKIEDALSELNFARDDRRFTPHLTLGRVRSPKNKAKLIRLIESTNFESKNSVQADAVTFFQSTLTPNGSIYTVLHRAKFRG